MPVLLRAWIMSSLLILRGFLWTAVALFLALAIFVNMTLPPKANGSISNRVGRVWDGTAAWIELKIFDQKYLAAVTVSRSVDPDCKSALGRETYKAVLQCGRKCRKYPRPHCA